MTDARETHLIRMARTLRCRGEIEGFRQQIADQGETITGALMAALVDRDRAAMIRFIARLLRKQPPPVTDNRTKAACSRKSTPSLPAAQCG